MVPLKKIVNTGHALVETHHLNIGYRYKERSTVLSSNINLSLRAGEFVCLLGPNGAGKSTLIRTLAGIQPSLQGTVLIGSKEVGGINRRDLAKLMSLVLTDPVNTGNLNVYTLLTLGRYPYTNWFGVLTEKDKAIMKEAVMATGIGAFLHKQMDQLSDGEKQKVMITRALIQDTPLIILDEPTAHLDLPNRVEVIRLLKRMARTTNKAILLSTHELDLALQAADTIWLMMPHQQLLAGAPEDLILSGRFERAFTREGVDFCKSTGTFKVNAPEAGKYIALHGAEGINKLWTRRALEREGYHITEEAPLTVLVHTNEDEYGCTLVSPQEENRFSTVAELTRHLKVHPVRNETHQPKVTEYC